MNKVTCKMVYDLSLEAGKNQTKAWIKPGWKRKRSILVIYLVLLNKQFKFS